MADNVTEVLFKLKSDSAELRKDLASVDKGLDKADKSAKGASATLSQMGQGLRNIANQAGLGGLVNSFDKVAGVANVATGAITNTGKSVVKTTGLVKFLTVATKALLGVFGLVAVAVGILGSAFLSTQRGADALNRAKSVLSATFQSGIGVLQEYAFKLVDTGNIFKAVGTIITDFLKLLQAIGTIATNSLTIATLQIELFAKEATLSISKIPLVGKLIDEKAIQESINQTKNDLNDLRLESAEAYEQTFGAVGEFFEEAKKKGLQIAELERQIALNRIKEKKDIADLNTLRIEALKLERQKGNTLETQLEGSKKVQEIDQQIAQRKLNALDKEIELQALINGLNNTSNADEQKYQDLLAQRVEILNQAVEGSLRSSVRESQFLQQIIDRNEKLLEQKLELAGDEIQITQNKYNSELKLLEQFADADVKTKEEVAKVKELLEIQLQKDLQQIRINAQLDELEQQNIASETRLLQIETELVEAQKLYAKGTQERIDAEKEATDKILAEQTVSLQNQIDKLENILETSALDSSAVLTYKNQIAALRLELAKLGEDLDDVGEKSTETFSDKFNSALDGVGEVASSVFDILGKRSQAELDRIDEAIRKNQENIAEALGLAERGNTQAIEIERKRQEALDVQREQALLKEQRRAAAQIAIEKALAAAKILVEAFTAGPAAFGTVAAKIGLAVSAITLLTALVPKFEKGTEFAPEGMAMVDEKGAEIITDRKGRIKTLGQNKGARFQHLNLGDKVIPAQISQQILADMGKPREKEAQGQNIAKAIKGLQSSTNVTIDKKGLYIGIKGVKNEMRRIWQ